MRCLALADALAREGGQVLLLTNPDATQVLGAPGGPWQHLSVAPGGQAAVDALLRHWPEGADLCVVDHYGWDARDERLLQSGARRVVVIDDLANRAHACDLLVDQNLGRRPDDYAGLVGPEVPLLTGPRYALLRAAFAAARSGEGARGPAAGSALAVLISLGLSDPGGVLLGLCQGLAQRDMRARFQVVVSPGAASHAALVALCAQDSRFSLEGPQDAEGMAGLMLAADVAIGGAGVTAWERCALCLPSLVLVLADNQRAGATALAAAGAARVFEADAAGVEGLIEALDGLVRQPATLGEMARVAGSIADGRGAARVAAACGDMMAGIGLRVAGPADGAQVWRWRNAPAARAASRVTDEIPLDAHLAWYDRAIADPRRVILVGRAAGVDVGMVRFDETAAGTWEVSIALDPACAGRGLGGRVLQRACAWMRAEHAVRRFSAMARETNAASLRIFERNGFAIGAPHQGWVAMTTERHGHGTA